MSHSSSALVVCLVWKRVGFSLSFQSSARRDGMPYALSSVEDDHGIMSRHVCAVCDAAGSSRHRQCMQRATSLALAIAQYESEWIPT